MLSKKEEELMQHLWKLEKGFMKDLRNAFPDPKPATTTVATLLKRMANKGFVGYRKFGSVREYYPLVKKEDYFSKHLKGFIKHFFDDSPSKFASFFTKQSDFSEKELNDLKKIIDDQIKKQKE